MIVGHDQPTGCRGSSGLDTRVISIPETATAQRSNPMTGLDLESFLLLLRADLTTWLVLGLATVGLGVFVWSSWRSRRALRNCLVLSLAAHLGLVLYGSTIPAVMWTLGPDRRDAMDRAHIRQIRVAPLVESIVSMGATAIEQLGSGPLSNGALGPRGRAPEAGRLLAQGRSAEHRRSVQASSRSRDQAGTTAAGARCVAESNGARRHLLSRVPSRSRRIIATRPNNRCRCLPAWLNWTRSTP